jgi:hypothetical protein
MIWWVVAALVALGVVLLVLVVLPVTRRLPELRRAMVKIRQRAVDAEEFRRVADALQAELTQVSARVEATRQRAAGIGASVPEQRR